MVNKQVSLGNIVGGENETDRKIGNRITIEDLLQLYRKNPTAKIGIQKLVRGMFHNGFSEEFPSDKKNVLMKAAEYAYLFGYALIITEGDNIEAWNPHVGSIGFVMKEFDEDGELVTAWIQKNTNEIPESYITVTNDPSNPNYVEGRVIHLIRNSDGLPGVRGESKILSLVDVLVAGFDLYILYLSYAIAQGMKVPDVSITNYTLDKENIVRRQMESALKEGDALIHSDDIEFTFVSPQEGNYDPSSILEKSDEYVSRVTQLNKPMLTGSPEGHLASSLQALMAWYSYVREEQDFMLPELLDVFEALGYTREIKFNDPEEFSREQKYNNIKLMREALTGLVGREDQLIELNMLLGTEYVLVKEEEIENDRGTDGDSGGTGGNDRGTDRESETPEDG